MTRHLIRDDDLTPDEQAAVLDLAVAMKKDRHGFLPLAGPKTVALMFDKPSTRTRVSFSVGVTELGGVPLILDSQTTQAGRGESVEDTTRVLDRQVAAIAWRTFEQSNLERMAAISKVPVVNTLSDRFHPCQLLADLQTIKERKGKLAGLTLAYVGDAGNNMAHSYLIACALAGMHVRVAGPERFQPDADVVNTATALASETGGSVDVSDDAKRAAYGADVLATDTWASMGTGSLGPRELASLTPFAVDESLLGVAGADAFVLHCLPAYRGKEIAASVIDGPHSAVWDQAENRLHAQKALLTFLLDGA